MDDALSQRLQEGASRLGVALEKVALDQLGRYLELLLTWNRRINLTAIDVPSEVVDKHFLDSLTIVPLLEGARSLLDVGSGAGFPGAVAAVAMPGLRVTCVDSIQKKVAFLQTLRRELHLDLEPLSVRHDVLVGQRTFDAVVSRATWDPREWLAQGSPLVAPGGVLIAMQSGAQDSLEAPPGFVALAPRELAIGEQRRRVQGFRREA